MSFKSKSLIAMMLILVLCMSCVGASACTAIYVGSDLTTDGTTLFARSEDFGNSYNKLYYFSPAGTYTAGEAFSGCYGFTYTFENDSYSFTTFSDDNHNAEGVCPDCGGTHKHNPYGAAGTNEMGVTVTATETLYTSSPVYDIDPFVDTGIEEAEITTILLSEAATAKEAVDLLLKIYDNAGCNNGSGIFIADNTETWYVENVTGTQYVAVKLNSSVAFAVPNQSVIALIDLDDTENVIASADLIAKAKEAGTYVGDEEANTIDYVASYNGDQVAGERMIDALKYFNAATAKDEPANSDYTISNVDAEGNIVPFYSNITLDHAYSVSDIVGYYHIPSIGKSGNLEIHIFQISAEDSITDTVEWVAMDNGRYSPFVPYYPMLTTDTYAAYKTSTDSAVFTQEEPTEGIYYPTTGRIMTEEGRVTVEGFKTLPANWADSYYWTFDALSNLADYAGLTEEQIAQINAKIEELQNKCYDAAATLADAAANAESQEAAAQACTEISMKLAEEIHLAAVELVNSVK